jgi:integrase
MWIREFAKTFPNHAPCDLAREHIDRYMADHADVGPKSRNERRGVLRMFLKWCVKKDYLPATHRLLEADGMAREIAEPADIELYAAAELQAMLDRASRQPMPAKKGEKPEADYRPLLPIIALVALGGVRLQEAARMTFADVWHVEGHIEVPAGKSKTRARRLSTMPASLTQWFESYRGCSGPMWAHCLDHFHRAFEAMLGELKIPVRRNALRHGFVSAHYALYSDEGLTAKEAGNSPAMVHRHYKGLLTKKQGEAWFAVSPAKAANVIQLSTSRANP